MEHTQFMTFVESLDTLQPSQHRLLVKALSADIISEPSQLLALIERNFNDHPCCPRCQAETTRRWGHQSGRQRYKCMNCQRTFNAMTKTPLAHLRVPEVIDQYVDAMLDSITLRSAARRCRISLPTSFKLRHRIMAVIQADKAALLSGIAEMDETFFRESFKGQRHMPREPRKRGRHLRKAPHHSSKKKKKPKPKLIPVFVAMDREGHVIDGVLKHVSAAELRPLLEHHIKPETPLCADAHLAHEAVAKKLSVVLKELVISSGLTVLEDVFHIQHVNAYHSHLKGWINYTFHGVATKYLYRYLGWRRLLSSKDLNVRHFLERVASHWAKPLFV